MKEVGTIGNGIRVLESEWTENICFHSKKWGECVIFRTWDPGYEDCDIYIDVTSPSGGSCSEIVKAYSKRNWSNDQLINWVETTFWPESRWLQEKWLQEKQLRRS